MGPQEAGQLWLSAALLADPAVVALVAKGKSVFAQGAGFEDVYPRVTFGAPQWIPQPGACGRAGDLVFTVNSWARGPDCTLVAGALADAVSLVLDTDPAITGWRCSTRRFEGSNPVGDPSPGIDRQVSTFRYSVQATA